MADEGTASVAGNILLVDEDSSFLELCRSLLETAGFSVTTVERASDALQAAADARPALAAISVALPVMDGEDLAAGLYHLYDGGVPILLLTTDDRGASRGAKRLGVYEALSKPFRRTDLLAAVQRGLDLRETAGGAKTNRP